MYMDIQETRRTNLAKWLETHSTPQKEKSLFSQLKSGASSFGERLARRLESTYGMGDGFLDLDATDNSPKRGDFPPLSPEAHELIMWVERADAIGDPARKIFASFTSILKVAESMGDPHNASAVRSLIAEEPVLEREARRTGRSGVHDAGSKRRARK
jgi:hypothetical protein